MRAKKTEGMDEALMGWGRAKSQIGCSQSAGERGKSHAFQWIQIIGNDRCYPQPGGTRPCEPAHTDLMVSPEASCAIINPQRGHSTWYSCVFTKSYQVLCPTIRERI